MVKAIEGIPELTATWRGTGLVSGSRLPVTLTLRANADRTALEGELLVTAPDGSTRRSLVRLRKSEGVDLVLEYPDNRQRLNGRIEGRQIFFAGDDAAHPELLSGCEVWTVMGDDLELQAFDDPGASKPVWSARLSRARTPGS
jgi:hypothetical protein